MFILGPAGERVESMWAAYAARPIAIMAIRRVSVDVSVARQRTPVQ